MNLRDFKTVAERRKALEKELDVSLSNIGSYTLDEATASTRNCENMIGVAQVPMGIAGPLKINGKDYYLPLATTEGALVASVNRGCKAITQSGGATVMVNDVGVTRSPVFETNGINEGLKLKVWLDKNFSELQTIVAETSSHLTLKNLETRIVGKQVFVRFSFDTTDAMGMNMATIASSKLAKHIEEETSVRCVAVAGNFDIDKKPAWLNSIAGRGKQVWAEVTIPSNIIKETLKTSAQAIYDVWLAKCMIGSAISGSLGFNAQFANIIAALFLATGQDAAHVVEGSIGITTTQLVDKDHAQGLYVSIYLPDVMVGAVGGGTGLATQKEALSILGITKSRQFAEVVGAAVLAGEISLLASLSEGTLARAHKVLARGGR